MKPTASSRSQTMTAEGITTTQTLLFSVAAGIIVTNLFATQTVVAQIGKYFEMDPGNVGLVSMLTMFGYAFGMIFLLPLIDKLENRGLILGTIITSVLSLICAAMAPTEDLFLLAIFVVGGSSSALQMIVVTSALHSPESSRGRVVGSVMSGLMLGVLFSRPLGSLIGGEFGWHAIYRASAFAQIVLALLLARVLPTHKPPNSHRYFASLASLPRLLVFEPLLRRRALYQALLMITFNIFWTAVAWRLAEPPFKLGANGIALFALVGAGGAIISPLAGRAGDRGHSGFATLAAHVTVVSGIVLAIVAAGSWGWSHSLIHPWVRMSGLAIAALLLDIGVVADQALGRRAINMIRPEARGRINGLFTGMFFIGGAVGAALAGPAWAYGGWNGLCCAAFIPAFLALLLRLSEPGMAVGQIGATSR